MIKASDIQGRVVFDAASFLEAIKDWNLDAPVVADVETYGLEPKDGKLLGVALCSVERPTEPIYAVVQWYEFGSSQWHSEGLNSLVEVLREFLPKAKLVGHNYAYDKSWLDHVLGLDTTWKACTRLMWHLASAPAGPKPYGLKDAQVDVLGWERRGDDEVASQVEARGGKLKEGGHYLADVATMGRYACLDAASTALLYKELSFFFDNHNYWWMLERMVTYSWLLQQCTAAGICVDVEALERQAAILSDTRGAYASRFLELVAPHVTSLERFWREDRAAKYTNAPARDRFLATWDLQKKFNVSSDKDKRELFYTCMRLPVVVETDGGKPSTGIEAIKAAVRQSGEEGLSEIIEAYSESESSETLLNSFAKPWLGALRNGRLHPRFNPCGTVSYRLSGFKPYLLNAPFDERELMSCLGCDPGWGGVHADFASVEPCVTAHYSQDPSLLKVFRQGLGDVYLDLALTLFPNDQELKGGYHPGVPVTSEVKERFKKQRKVAKVIQLAVQYTGTKYTIAKNLSIAGIPTSLDQADLLVKAYWAHFHKVAVMNKALFLRYAKQGLLRNVVGRIIRVPYPTYKDLPNRFIQSSAHDLLSFWVLKIAEKIKQAGFPAKAVILDCHDSTTWQCPKEYIPLLEDIFILSLRELNEEVRMTVPIKIEMKRFQTLAGLKGEE